jgi:integrase
MLKRGQDAHEIPLSRQAVALIEAQDRRGAYVFGRAGRTGFSGFSRAKARLDTALGSAVGSWTLHDTRHTFVTLMADHGLAQPHVIEAAINHLSGHKGGIAGRYNKATYRPEKAAAFQAWADWLEATAEGREPGSNVVPMRVG